MKITLAVFILYSLSALAMNKDLSPEVRLPAEHEMREGQVPLTAVEMPPQEGAAPSVVSSTYRNNITRSGYLDSDILPINLKLDWRVPLINLGFHSASKSSPAVDASGIYVGSDSSWFYAYDKKGHLIWRRFIPDSKFGIHGTATLDQTKVYFGGYNGILYALNKKDGKLVWSRKLGDAIGSSPVVHKDFIYIAVEKTRPVNGLVAKLKVSDGTVVWTTQPLGEQPHSSPVINENAGLVHVGANNGIFFGLDIQTGQIKWRFTDGKPIKDTANLIGQTVCFGTWSAKLYCLDAGTGTKLWESVLSAKSRTSPTYVPDLDYLITATEDGVMSAVNFKDGKQVWKLDTKNRHMISSSLVLRDAKSKTSGRWIIWDNCDRFFLCAIEARSGEVLSKYDIMADLTSVPVFYKGGLYISTNRDGGLQAFSPKAK